MTVVKLNVGGQLFVTTQATLENFPSMLSTLCQHSHPASLIDGYLFIDRDPSSFRWILNYLRGSHILPPRASTEMSLLFEEASYFAVDGLLARLQHVLQPAFTKGVHISVRETKFTILEVEDNGYLATRGGQKYRLDSSEIFQQTSIEAGDLVTVFRAGQHKWGAGRCLSVQASDCVVQCENVSTVTHLKLSGVRF